MGGAWEAREGLTRSVLRAIHVVLCTAHQRKQFWTLGPIRGREPQGVGWELCPFHGQAALPAKGQHPPPPPALQLDGSAAGSQEPT